MKRFSSAFLIGVIAAFVVLQLLYYRQHGFSFTVIFQIDHWYLLRALSYLALVILGLRAWQLIRGKPVRLELGMREVGGFAVGVFALACAYFLWRAFGADSDDYKFTPYLVVPHLYLVALACFYGLVVMQWRVLRRYEG